MLSGYSLLSGRRRASFWLLLIVVAFYWKLTLTSQFDWIWGPDLAGQVLPWFELQARGWHDARLPLWDPYLWAGQPLLAQAQPGAAYPLNWILFALPLQDGHIAPTALQWYFVLIHFLAALFGYKLCRELGQSSLAGIAGGLAFSLGGYVGGTGWPQMLNGAIWFPLVLLYLLRALRGDNLFGNAALSGMFLGISFLSGHHQIPVIAGVVVAGVWIFCLSRSGRVNLRMAGAAAVTFAMAGLTSALQLLPAMEYGRLGKRWVGTPEPLSWGERVPYYIHERFQLPVSRLLALLFPSIGAQFQAYIGVVVVALAAIGLAVSWRDLRTRIVAAIGVFGVVYSLGAQTAFQGVLYSVVPWLDKARAPSSAVFFIAVAAAALAGYGLDHLGAAEPSVWPRRAMWAALSLGIFTFAICEVLFVASNMSLPANDQFMITGVACLALAALLFASIHHHLSSLQVKVGIIALLVLELSSVTGFGIADRTDQARAAWMNRTTANRDIALYLTRQPGYQRAEVLGDAFQPNWGDFHGVEMWGGILGFVTSNMVSLDFASDQTRNLFGVGFAIAKDGVPAPGAPVFIGASGLKVYRRAEAFPRAWAVHNVVRVRDIDAGRAIVDARLPELHNMAFTLEAPPALEACGAEDRVTIVQKDPDQIRIVADLACAGMVVLSDTFYPGWRARVDSRLEPIYEVNGAMRGVVVPAGRHAITLRYCPLSVIVGAAATLLGVVVSLLLFGIGRRRRPQDSRGSPTGPLEGPGGVEESATPPASSMSSSADEGL
jgi:hypothetical protein